MVGLSTDFVFHGKYWLVYHPVLSIVDNIGWYINWFYLSRKYWLVYLPVVSVIDNMVGI